MKTFEKITNLLHFAVKHLELDPLDVNFVRNQIIDSLGLNTYEVTAPTSESDDVDLLLREFSQTAVEEGVFEEQFSAYYCDKIMGLLSLRPSQLDKRFAQVRKQDGSFEATKWLYDYCVNNNYVKKAVLDKNPRYDRNGLVITINLAKPEFRSASSAKSGNAVAGGYPSCVICRENEGFTPRGKSTLRTVSLTIDGQPWFWQYSPYGYFYQHGILVNTKHIPMHVDEQTFVNLMDFVDQFPHYFVGCNAALERIGGSVLAHDHYQGGGEVLPLFKAPLTTMFKSNYDDVEIGILDWPGTVVRVSSANKQHLIEVCERIRKQWSDYDNESLGILHGKDGKQFSSISPTVVKVGNVYQMNVILRNNITSELYPDGVFHAHPEFHVIKKESIGLIEAQGLFILPGRLVNQLDQLEDLICNNLPLTEELADFQLVYDETKTLVKALDKESVHYAMQSEIASICYRILQNTAVFKQSHDFEDFLQDCGLTKI